MWAEIQSLEAPAVPLEADLERRFSAFVAAHRDRALGMAWRLTGGDPAAEDVVQEAFARAYRGLDRFREQARLSTWFYRILYNEVQRHLRWRWLRRGRSAELPADVADPAAERRGDPVLRARVAAAIAALPRGQREAFVLVHLEGWTVREAAEISGRAVGTLKSHLHRALRALRTELADLAPSREETS